MKILALIPARGGSKRLPGKNIRELGGKPLVVWTIDAAKSISKLCDILVSTDDPAIGEVCAKAGAFVPWLRPLELASDTASPVDVALHALDWYEDAKGPVDCLLLLQPTSPFRSQKTFHRGISLFAQHGMPPVLGVSRISHTHPMWAFKIDGIHLVPFLGEHGLNSRSQDLPPSYAVNGSFYFISPRELRARRTFIGPKTIPLVMESEQEAWDIDTPFDWLVAESLLGQAKGEV